MAVDPYIIIPAILVLILLSFYFILRRKRIVRITTDEHLLLLGKRFDRYEIRSFLVRGDLSTTFAAFDGDRKKIVALRILIRDFLHADTIIAHFSRQGELLKYLSESDPAQCFIQNVRFGAASANNEIRPFIVTDYVQGASLAEVLQRCGRISANDTLAILRLLGGSISFAHSQQIWFREFSPKNILLSLNNKGGLIAQFSNVGIPFKDLPTENIKELRKRFYSPEDIKYNTDDERSDVYALAALAYCLIDGKEYDPSLPDNRFGGSLKHLALALSGEPTQRPASVLEFVDRLAVWAEEASPLKDQNWNILLSGIVRSRERHIYKIVERDYL